MGDITISSGNVQQLERKRLGLYSLDLALSSRGELGIPLRSITMFTGRTHVGKSTSGYFLLGTLGSESGQVGLADFEGLDLQYLESAVGVSGYKGNIKLVDGIEKGKLRRHSAMGQELVGLLENKYGCVMLDSVGAFVPDAEAVGDIGEAFMGKRAHTLAQIVRRAVMYLNYTEKPSNFVLINHTHSLLAGQGSSTAGGDTIRNLSHIILSIWNKEVVKNSKDEILGFRIAGVVDKLRYGGKGRKFSYVILPDIGISKEMSALYDCSDLELIDRGRTVKVDGKSVGYISDLYQAAAEKKTNKFDVFFEKLEEHHGKNVLGNPKFYEDPEATED